MQLPHCPKCHSEYTYEDGGMFICPECAHEWNNAEPADDNDALVVKDANGNLLADGGIIFIKSAGYFRKCIAKFQYSLNLLLLDDSV